MTATTGSRIVEEEGTGRIEVWSLPTDEASLEALLTATLLDAWQDVTYGPYVQGSVFELRSPQRPTLAKVDGYLTFGWGQSHFHICIGEHRGASPELARHRRTASAELFRILQREGPVAWAVRLRNGAGEEQLTIWLPNPLLGDHDEIDNADNHNAHNDNADTAPEWSRLALWDELRATFLGLGPDPADRTASRFIHG